MLYLFSIPETSRKWQVFIRRIWLVLVYRFHNAPYGFVKSAVEKNKLAIDEESAAVVRRIFDLACDGESTAQIAAALNRDGVDTPFTYLMRKGRVYQPNASAVNERIFWTDDSVRKILRNQHYIGVQISGRSRSATPGSNKRVRIPDNECVRVVDAHEAIVDKGTFERVNSAVRQFKPCAPQKRSLFAGKMRCGHCGRALTYRGSNHPYYFCNGALLSMGMGCSADKILVEDLRILTLHAVKVEAQKALDTRQKQRGPGAGAYVQMDALAELKRLNAQIDLLERRSVMLYEDFAEGKLDRDGYLAAKSKCTSELAEANAHAVELNGQLSALATKEDVPRDEPLLQRVLDAGEVTSEVLALIDRVVMYDPERIEIRFAFGDANTFGVV